MGKLLKLDTNTDKYNYTENGTGHALTHVKDPTDEQLENAIKEYDNQSTPSIGKMFLVKNIDTWWKTSLIVDVIKERQSIYYFTTKTGSKYQWIDNSKNLYDI